MINIVNVSKSFAGQNVLKNISLDIHRGEIVAILGASGAGKSVLLQHLIGLFVPDEGSILIGREDTTYFSEKHWLAVRKKTGYLFQDGALYDFMTVFENVAFPLKEHTSLTDKEISDKVREVLRTVGLEGVDEKMPSELSGGMRKRAALARAVILDSQFLFCDEPTSGLDPMRSREIMDLIHDISRTMKTTTVITSHDVRNALRVADRLAIIQDGVMVTEGTAQELEKSNDALIKEFLT
jgi:phospholipid/cholesterol/gamma-HCH transport system ATP-binding protein